MGKRYNTGKSAWEYGQKIWGSWHSLLGPCPKCGTSTFDYGGLWACNNDYCQNSPENTVCNNGPDPSWWNTDINVFMDGNAWCATRDGFVNLQESPAGFGDTPNEAVKELIKNEEVQP